MPDLDVTIGGKVFTVSCQPGEEHFLRGAAQLLDAEATPLMSAMGRLPEASLSRRRRSSSRSVTAVLRIRCNSSPCTSS